MKIAYTPAANGEVYLVGKNEARRMARARYPNLDLLAFQTRHGPKMSPDVAYLATFTPTYVRILSIRPEFASAELRAQFHERVLPYICDTADYYGRTSYFWPVVVVAIDQVVYQASCSAGWLFPNRTEILRSRPLTICSLDPASSR